MEQTNKGLKGLLSQNGYRLIGKVGEGYWREVFEVNRFEDSGEIKEKLVAKVDKEQGPTESVQHRINLSKGNLSTREIEVLRSLSHPNITKIYDVLKTEDGKPVLIEGFHDSISLEEYLEMWGPILHDENFIEIFSQVTEAMRYLHIEKGILHRDIKPSNILIGFADKRTSLTDFQNAASLEDVEQKFLPTRGGTAYTHPSLLNALAQGEKSKATFATEIYALGASMFYALTKRCPFNYNLIGQGPGTGIDPNISLSENGERIAAISPEQHEMQLRHELAQVPQKYGQLVYGCLSLRNGLCKNNSPKEMYRKLNSLLEGIR